MISDVPGFLVGHYTDPVAMTGCTVLLCPPHATASCEVRGSSPGSRELSLLAPEKQMQEIHAILLTGGSAYGLGAANGVMQFLAERSIGYATPYAIVPIVSSAVIFDLNLGRSDIFPTAENAYAACAAAASAVSEGNVGAGTGATVGKWNGFACAMKGGVGTASFRLGDLVVGALVVVNAVGDVIAADGSVMAGAQQNGRFLGEDSRIHSLNDERLLLRNSNTTLVIAATNAALSKVDTYRVAQRMHDGMARAIKPCHTTFDGDVTFAISAGSVSAPVDLIAEISTDMTTEAIRSAVRHATTVAGVGGLAS